MAEEAEAAEGAEGAAAEGGDEEGGVECPACEVCVPGLPAWMATFSDLVTLLLTFFVLLLSFAKTEVAKYEAALGSIKNAFGGNVLKQGEVLQPGKSPDDAPVMIDAAEPIKPFPIDFLTMEGILDKHEINRNSTEDLNQMKSVIKENNLSDSVDVYEMPEGVKVNIKDKMYFKEGSAEVEKFDLRSVQKIISIMKENDWTLFIEGHAARGETTKVGGRDAYFLSAMRASGAAKYFLKRGVQANKITTVFYGDSRPDEAFANSADSTEEKNRRVEFVLRKVDLRTIGHKVTE